MASIYDLKPRFQNLLRPLCRWLAARGVTANQVTLAAAALSIATGTLLAMLPTISGLFLLVPLVLFVRMALNAIDGMLAREHDMASPLGAMLNELGDVISDACLYLPFALLGGAPWLVLFVLLAVLTEMSGVVAVMIGASRRYDGPFGKSDRAFVVGALALAIGLGLTPGGWLIGVWILLAAASAWTLLNRVRAALREVADA